MYNLLEKLRSGQPFTDGDREYNNKALVSTLKQIHDELDVAVLEAYGWQDLVPMLSPSPLAPLPAGEGNRNQSLLPSPLGRRVGDEEQIEAENPESLDVLQPLSPSPLAPLSAGEGNRIVPPSPLGRRVGDEGQIEVENPESSDVLQPLSPSPLAPLPAGEGNRIMPPSPLGRRAGDEGQIELSNPENLDVSQPLSPSPLAPLPAGEGNRKDVNGWDGEFSHLAGRWRQIPDAFLERVRQLRQEQTPAEKFLWELLRDRRFLNAKFRRQHTLGPYIADFYCHQARLVIELDGDIHQNQTLRDEDRDQWMQANGLTVVRVSNAAICHNTAEVLNAIAEVICPSPLTPIPAVERNQIVPPSPLGRKIEDERQSMNDKTLDEIILERLVALNAERAAEERNGLIRWLRPEYQAPDQAKPTQTTLEGIGVKEEPETIAPVEQQKWPTQPKAQLAAIRDLLRTSSGEWTALQIASQFTGRNTQKKLDAVMENCDRLEWFGLLIRRDEAGCGVLAVCRVATD
jgi:very-short-patch-repair endonuclease